MNVSGLKSTRNVKPQNQTSRLFQSNRLTSVTWKLRCVQLSVTVSWEITPTVTFKTIFIKPDEVLIRRWLQMLWYRDSNQMLWSSCVLLRLASPVPATTWMWNLKWDLKARAHTKESPPTPELYASAADAAARQFGVNTSDVLKITIFLLNMILAVGVKGENDALDWANLATSEAL